MRLREQVEQESNESLLAFVKARPLGLVALGLVNGLAFALIYSPGIRSEAPWIILVLVLIIALFVGLLVILEVHFEKTIIPELRKRLSDNKEKTPNKILEDTGSNAPDPQN